MIVVFFQWLPGRAFIVYRVILALYTTAFTVLGAIKRQEHGVKWFIFLTNWSYTFLNLHFLVSAFIVIYYHCNRRRFRASDEEEEKEQEEQEEEKEEEDPTPFVYDVKSRLPLACKASWVIYDIAANIAFPVTVVYWSLVHVPGLPYDSVTFNAHALNSVVIVLDTMLSCIRVKLLHIVYPIIFITIYLVFSLIYWACGGTDPDNKPYIYAALDYGGHPVRAVITICLFVSVGNVMSQLLLFGLYRLRIWLKRFCCCVTLTAI